MQKRDRVLAAGSRILITGGAGFIGAPLARKLASEGYAVRVLDDLSRGRRERLDDAACELVTGDVRAERAVRDAMEGVQAVVHLAAPPRRPKTPREERTAHDVAVTGAYNVLAAARDAKVARFVYASSGTVYSPKPFLLHEDLPTQPISLEGAQKCAAEAYVRVFAAQGLAACSLRIFSAYGEGQDGAADDAGVVARFLYLARTGQALTIEGDGAHTRDFIHVSDVVSAIGAALIAPGIAGRAFNVAGGEAVSVLHVAAVITDLSGGLLPAPRLLRARPAEAALVRASIAAASSALGWKPKIRLREGLATALGRPGAFRAATPAPVAAPPAVRRPSATPAHGVPVAILPQELAAAISVAPLFADRPNSWEVPEQ